MRVWMLKRSTITDGIVGVIIRCSLARRICAIAKLNEVDVVAETQNTSVLERLELFDETIARRVSNTWSDYEVDWHDEDRRSMSWDC